MTTTELDDLREAWRVLDRRLAVDVELRLEEARDRRLRRTEATLRPLAWGQAALAIFGLAILLLGASAWIDDRGNPAVFAAGIVLHVYGVLTMIAAGSTLARIRSIDYAAPVLAIQARLVALRRWYVGWSRFVGLAWWLLWIPLVIALSRPEPAPLEPSQAAWLVGSALFGVVGLLVTWAVHRWLRDPARAELERRLDDGAAGRSLLRAQAEIESLRAMEDEHGGRE